MLINLEKEGKRTIFFTSSLDNIFCISQFFPLIFVTLIWKVDFLSKTFHPEGVDLIMYSLYMTFYFQGEATLP